MSWFVVVPAAWFGIALALGLLIGRCVRMEELAQPAVQTVGRGPAAPPTMDAGFTGADSASAGTREDSLARTV